MQSVSILKVMLEFLTKDCYLLKTLQKALSLTLAKLVIVGL